MDIVRTLPKTSSMPPLRTFQCPDCDFVVIVEVEI